MIEREPGPVERRSGVAIEDLASLESILKKEGDPSVEVDGVNLVHFRELPFHTSKRPNVPGNDDEIVVGMALASNATPLVNRVLAGNVDLVLHQEGTVSCSRQGGRGPPPERQVLRGLPRAQEHAEEPGAGAPKIIFQMLEVDLQLWGDGRYHQNGPATHTPIGIYSPATHTHVSPMSDSDPIREALGWLLLEENARGLRVLQVATEGPIPAGELQSRAGIEHPQQLYRVLDYLEDRGLIDRLYERQARREVFSTSPLGRRALELRVRVMRSIAGPHRSIGGHAGEWPLAAPRA